MGRLLEMLLGLPREFLSQGGELAVRFHPVWPWREAVGSAVWNLLIAVLMGWLIVHVYRREGRSRPVRMGLAALRVLLAGLVLLLLNRPVVSLTKNRVEPSVVGLLVDDSLSMRVRDVEAGTAEKPATQSRLEAVQRLLGDDGKLLADLARTHVVRLYRFDRSPAPVATVEKNDEPAAAATAGALARLEPGGNATALGESVATVAEELAGQRVAGLVVLTDGREAPARPLSEAIARLRALGGGAGGAAGGGTVKVYAVAVGGERAPRNLSVTNLVMQDSAFSGDLVAVRATVRGTGYPPGTRVQVKLTDARSGRQLTGATGLAEQTVTLTGENPVDVEVPLKPDAVGELDVAATATVLSDRGPADTGEVDEQDNFRVARLAVLDARVNVLYIEGYPRWDYRFLRTELIRDKTVNVSILLTSADEGFAQEGDIPIRRLPETMDELLPYDAVIVGDVDPRQFTDAQLQLLADYVGKKGGGLMMVAGTRYAPVRYRGTALEAVLPVRFDAIGTADDVSGGDIALGFRPSVTTAGTASGVFRFLPDADANERFLKADWQPVFWYLKGVTVKPAAGETLAEHPTDVGPDGRKAPIVVAGRYGAGRTLFSAIDDSWRWRYYAGESVFDTYWVQQIRLLARNRKLGQRLYTLAASRTTYELGEQVTATLRILDTTLLRQLPDRIEATVVGADGAVLRREPLVRQEDRPDTYVGSYQAERLGRSEIRVGDLAPGVTAAGQGTGKPGAGPDGTQGGAGASVPVEVVAPKLELADVRLDRAALQRLAGETGGQVVPLAEASARLPGMIKSVEKVIPLESSRPLWDAPVVMLAFVLLISAEWLVRKLFGML